MASVQTALIQLGNQARRLCEEVPGFFLFSSRGPGSHSENGSGGSFPLGAHDDVVIALALAWFAAPEGAPVPMRERMLLGSQIGAGRRAASG